MGINDMNRYCMTNLLHAIRHENMDEALECIKDGADVNLARNNGVPLSRGEWIVQQKSLMIGEIIDGTYGETPLIYTVIFFSHDKDRSISLIDALLEAGADINKTDALGNTPLHHACHDNEVNVDVISHLISKGADINVRNCSDERGRTPLHKAVIEGNYEKTEVLLEAGADIDPLDGDGHSAYVMAIILDFMEIAGMLIENGAKMPEK